MLSAALSGGNTSHQAIPTLPARTRGGGPDLGVNRFTLCWWLRNTHLQGTIPPANAGSGGVGVGGS